MADRARADMQRDLIDTIARQPERPVIVSGSNYDFIVGFLSPNPIPEYLHRANSDAVSKG